MGFYCDSPYPSWTLNIAYKWVPPEPKPELPVNADGKTCGTFFWDEDDYNAGFGGWVYKGCMEDEALLNTIQAEQGFDPPEYDPPKE
jgi:hypothetical protein